MAVSPNGKIAMLDGEGVLRVSTMRGVRNARQDVSDSRAHSARAASRAEERRQYLAAAG